MEALCRRQFLRLASFGDRGWKELLDRHNTLVRNELGRFRGRELSTAGDSSGLVFADRGTYELKGVPGEWRLYAVEQ